MSVTQSIITILICSVATLFTRFIPFIIFNNKRKTPEIIDYLGKALPPAIFAMLVVYCLKSVSIITNPYGLPEAISLLFITAIHLWKKNLLLSISLGTVLYMFLVQVVF